MLTVQTQRRWFPTWKPWSAAEDQVDQNLKWRFRWCSKPLQLPDLFLDVSQPLFTSVAWTWRRTPRTSCFIPSRAWRPWRGGLAHYCSTGRAGRDPGIRQVGSTSSAATLWAEANSAPSWSGWTTNCLTLQRLTWEWRRDESILSHLGGVSCFFGSSEALIRWGRSCNLRGERQSRCSMPRPSLCCHFRRCDTQDVKLPPRSSLLFLPSLRDNRGVFSFFQFFYAFLSHAFSELTVYLALKLIFGRKNSVKVCAAIINRFLWINGDLPKKLTTHRAKKKERKQNIPEAKATSGGRKSCDIWKFYQAKVFAFIKPEAEPVKTEGNAVFAQKCHFFVQLGRSSLNLGEFWWLFTADSLLQVR